MLINNAGALFNKRQETADGLEMTFALNHMAYFIVTNLLLRQAEAGRAHRLDGVRRPSRRQAGFQRSAIAQGLYAAFAVYAKSKLCNILFTRELARRLPAPASPPIACIPALSPPASATIPAG